MLVIERVDESSNVIKNIKDNESLEYKKKELSYARERFNSAVYWADFFDTKFNNEININIDNDQIKNSCINEIKAASELNEYVKFYIKLKKDNDFSDLLHSAVDYYEEKDYSMCVLKALEAKSNFNSILTLITIVDKESLKKFVENKMLAAKNEIINDENKKQFPIGGYSYYEYANSLKNSSMYDALIYSEYSLELSNLDLYLNKKYNKMNNNNSLFQKNNLIYLEYITIFLIGVIIGIFLERKTKK